jgi:hypothetical protein
MDMLLHLVRADPQILVYYSTICYFQLEDISIH